MISLAFGWECFACNIASIALIFLSYLKFNSMQFDFLALWRIIVSTQFHRMSILSVNKLNIEVYYAILNTLSPQIFPIEYTIFREDC